MLMLLTSLLPTLPMHNLMDILCQACMMKVDASYTSAHCYACVTALDDTYPA